MQYLLALIVALVLNATANLLMKIGMRSVQQSGGILRDGLLPAVKTVITSATLMTGLICFAVNALFYMYALQSKALKISIAYPIMVGGGFALIAVIARFHPLLLERLTWGQMIGVSLVLIGIVVIAANTNVAAA
jgi:small multidrug resistance pump